MNNTHGSYGIKRNDYKKVKGMNRVQMSEYLSKIWQRGYEAGVKSIGNSDKTASKSEI